MANTDTYKNKISPASITANVVTLGILFVFWQSGQKWAAIPLVITIIFITFLLPKVIKKKEIAFHRHALRLLSLGKASEVPDFARQQILLQLFGSSAPIEAKLGLAYSQTEDFSLAISCLDNAIPFAPVIEKPALQIALAKALFVTGDPARAEIEGRRIVDARGVQLPEIMVMVARARIGLHKLDQQTQFYLRDAKKLSCTEDVMLMIDLSKIEFDMATGRKPADIPNDADSSSRFIRAWIHFVRGKLRERKGDNNLALESFVKCAQLGLEDYCWFSNLARERIETLSGKEHLIEQNIDSSIDSVTRRKKKKRR